MEPATMLQFTRVARLLAHEAQRLRLRVPSFRCPPRIDGIDRSLRRRADGGVTVSVRLKDRPLAAVMADMVDGVVVANCLAGVSADRARSALWESLAGVLDIPPARVARVA
jgi:hypothetical protein